MSLFYSFLWWLIWYTLRVALSIATTQPLSLSPFRLVVMSLANLPNGALLIGAMSLYHLAYIS
jgi:hypothetical protein